MTKPGTAATASYLDTLLRYYEEEISGEAYFSGLCEFYTETEKVGLLAQIERKAARAVEPLLRNYGLVPAAAGELKKKGESHLARHRDLGWLEFMAYIVRRYPLYLDDFRALEAMAPVEDLPGLREMTGHEIAVIEFAEMELAGNPDSALPLRRYLSRG